MHIVTGANGFIGSCMVWQLNQMGIFNILAVDTVPLSKRNLLKGKSYSKFFTPDELWSFLDPKSSTHQNTSAALHQEIKAFFHIGACSSTTETNWDYLFRNNVLESRKAFQYCTEHRIPLIYASSAATYGNGEVGFDDNRDSFELAPLNLYGKSKLLFDQWVQEQSEKPPHWYGLRYFNVYGPNEYHKGSQASLVVSAYKQIHEVGSLRLFKSYNPAYKDGEQVRDFIYVKDIIRWMGELLDKKPASGIYNLGTGTARTWIDLGAAVFAAMKTPEKIEFIDMPANIKDQYQYFTEAKMDKFLKLGLSKPQWTLESGINDYVRHYLSQDQKAL